MLDSIVAQLRKTTEIKPEVFYTHLSIPCDDLSLHVEPVGSVTFPISPKVAKSLIVEAEPARYGLKDKTLLNHKIRDTWEIPGSRVQTNNDWDLQLHQTLKKIQRDLNLPEDGVLTPELYNILMYMPGQFFKAHQDSEKVEGMVATLVVLLPSEFTGGEFVIDQQGDRRTLDFSNETTKNLTFLAFYSDCYHEVQEVKSGYRIALTYNLLFKSNLKSLVTIRNIDLEKNVQDYFFKMHENSDNRSFPSQPQWLVYLLDHEYTRNSLDWFQLRGLDRDRVGEFLACADQLGLTAHLALADVHKMWSTEEEGWSGRRYDRRWHDDEEENEDDDNEADSDNYNLTELIEEEIILRHWIARSGEKFEKRDKYIPIPMVCWTKSVDQFKPFESNYEGYMGNYGNTLDRWYHRAALVLWKKEDDLISLFNCDKVEALRVIGASLKKDLNQGHQMFNQVFPYWPKNIHRFLDPAVVLEFAISLQDQELASIVIKPLGIDSLQKKNISTLMKLVDSYGEEWLISILNSWRESLEWSESNLILDDLSSLVNKFNQKYKRISHWILQDQLSLLIQNDTREEKYLGRRAIRERLSKKIKAIEILLKVSHLAEEQEFHKKLIDHILKKRILYSEVKLVNLFITMDESIYIPILAQLGKRLKKQISSPRKEGDWSIQDEIPHDCSDCQYLKNFLLSAATQKMVWPLAKDRRAHIHQIIDEMDISVTHETVRQGSPHKLVLIKTSELFARDQERAKSIKDCLAMLRKQKIIEETGIEDP